MFESLPPVVSFKSQLGSCGAAAGGLDVCLAAMMVHEQTFPAIVNRDQPLKGFGGSTSTAQSAKLNHVLCVSTGLGGQNTAMVLKNYKS